MSQAYPPNADRAAVGLRLFQCRCAQSPSGRGVFRGLAGSKAGGLFSQNFSQGAPMNRYAWLLYQQDLRAWLKAELQCEYIRATDALLDLPKPNGQVDQAALQQWCEIWLSEDGWKALKQRSKVAVLPRRT